MNYEEYPHPIEERGPKWGVIIAGFAILLIAGAAAAVFIGRDGRLARMSAVDSWVSLANARRETVQEVTRGEAQLVYYHVVLSGAPLGLPLDLRCEWVDPSGRVALHNVYQTRFIYKSTWPTFCRQQFGQTNEPGAWQVRLLEGQRVVSSSSFALK